MTECLVMFIGAETVVFFKQANDRMPRDIMSKKVLRTAWQCSKTVVNIVTANDSSLKHPAINGI